MTDVDKIYVRFRGRTLGPLTSQKVQDLVRRGQITRMHELSGDGLSWSKAEDFGDFFSVTNETPANDDDDSLMASGAATRPSSEANPQSAVIERENVEEDVEWYAHVDGENRGPLTLAQVHDWKAQGRVHRTTLLWRSGLDTWQPADEVMPDLFRTSGDVDLSQTHTPPQPFNSGAQTAPYSSVAQEIDRRRGWAFFFAIVLIVLSSIQIFGQLAAVFIAAGGSAAGSNTTAALVGGMVGIAFAGTVMTAGILLLQFCSRARDFASNPSQNTALVAAQRLSLLWSFVGIASLVWLVIFMSMFVVIASIGLSIIDAFSPSAAIHMSVSLAS